MDYVIYSSESVVLTHIIKTKVVINDHQHTQSVQKCKICSEQADIYCENDKEYFCKTCDILAHEMDEA